MPQQSLPYLSIENNIDLTLIVVKFKGLNMFLIPIIIVKFGFSPLKNCYDGFGPCKF